MEDYGIRMRFAHLSDCHLGSWRHPELKALNMRCFSRTIDICIKERLDFVIIAGDLFDSPYPPIEILKETFWELRRLKDEGIPCFLIAGSHDFSASGKTFLDVLENAGLCKNVFDAQTREGDEAIHLNPTLYNNVAIYGYPGKKTGLDVADVKRVKLNDAPGYFKILMLHTSLSDAVGNLPIDSVDPAQLPKADYYALGHLHINYEKENRVYAGPTFPNNFDEIHELKGGSFYIVDTNPFSYKKVLLDLKQVVYVELEITNALVATDEIISQLSKVDAKMNDAIVLLKLRGNLEKGKVSNIDFIKISDYVTNRGAYCFLQGTSKLVREQNIIEEVGALPHLEGDIIKKFLAENKSGMNHYVDSLMYALAMEKKEDEKTLNFTERILGEAKKILQMPDSDEGK